MKSRTIFAYTLCFMLDSDGINNSSLNSQCGSQGGSKCFKGRYFPQQVRFLWLIRALYHGRSNNMLYFAMNANCEIIRCMALARLILVRTKI